MNALQRLKDAGLIVKSSHSGRRFLVDKPELEADATSHLRLDDTNWFFEVFEFIPGPGLDDFQCEFASFDKAIDAVLDFYFGKPIIIGGWIIPSHRHPELPISHIKPVLTKATHVTQKTFDEIEEKHWGEIWEYRQLGKWEHYREVWQYIMQHQFLNIPHIKDHTVTLRLRRDGKKAYIVYREDSLTSCNQ